MNSVQKYLKILRDIRAGKVPTKGDLKFFSEFSFDVDQKAIDELKNSPEFKDLSSDQVSKAMQDSFLLAVQDPSYRQDILSIAQENTEKDLGQKVTAGINTALAATDVINSARQINQGDRAAQRVRRPSRPSPLTSEPLLNQALSEARDQTGEVSRALAPSQLSILDSYLVDMDNARSVSGGQAGTYGALGQNAVTRRGRRSLELAPIADQIARQGEQRYDQLLAQKLAENSAIQQSQAQYYPYDLQQYSQDAMAAGQLGAAGRQNLRQSLTDLGGFLAQPSANFLTRKRYRDIYNSGMPYGAENAKIMADTDYRLYNDSFDPFYQQQFEQMNGLTDYA
jgi:hypothetical protein